ncbi:MAG: NAD(+) synthase [Lachnospiraceae bacterium]|nr:NAD(+) synthase [Lachnospiraceae bacterium]
MSEKEELNNEEYYEVVYSSSYSYEQQTDGPYATLEEAQASADEFNRNQAELYENSGHLALDVLKDYRTATVRGPYKKTTKEGTADFDAKKEIEHITGWIRAWFEENGPQANAVIGISGGKDSSIVAALLVRALGRERVTAVMMPDGVQADIADSRQLVETLGLKAFTVDVGPGVRGLRESVEQSIGAPLSRDAQINLPPRMRMATLYAVAQSLPGGGRVANTCNRSEDYIGYSTKYGDAAGDFSPCAEYLVTEMRLLGDALELPRNLVHKTPSDGLSGLSDEEKIGFSYEVLDTYIATGICEDKEIRDRIDRMHRLNLHKLQVIPTCHRDRS